MFVPLTPLRCLHRAIDVFGSKTGIVSGDRSFTYAQFGERCEKLATGLVKFGIQPGDRVAYLSFNTHQLLEGYFAVPLLRANVAFQAVQIPAGRHTIHLFYRDRAFEIGGAISICAWAFCCVSLLLQFRCGCKKESPPA